MTLIVTVTTLKIDWQTCDLTVSTIEKMLRKLSVSFLAKLMSIFGQNLEHRVTFSHPDFRIILTRYPVIMASLAEVPSRSRLRLSAHAFRSALTTAFKAHGAIYRDAGLGMLSCPTWTTWATRGVQPHPGKCSPSACPAP